MGVERRHALMRAVLNRDPAERPAPEDEENLPVLRSSAGRIVDVNAHRLILENTAGEEERLVIAPWATAWRGREVSPAELPAGAHVIVRLIPQGGAVERIWADVTRLTGTILGVSGGRDLSVELDCGPHRGRRTVAVPYRVSGRIRVRHPKLEPGYLFDAIGILEEGEPVACLPATSQPPYRAGSAPTPPPGYGETQPTISGTAVWSDGVEAADGVAYPMLEQADAGCAAAGRSCAGLPYLALGSRLRVRNVCARRSAVLPVVACGCVAGHFCDRCVECDTSPRGRIVEVTPVSFAGLGGELTKGCFIVRIGLE